MNFGRKFGRKFATVAEKHNGEKFILYWEKALAAADAFFAFDLGEAVTLE